MSSAVPAVEFIGEDEAGPATEAPAATTQEAPKKRGPGRPKKAEPEQKPEPAARTKNISGRWLVTMRHSPALRKSLIVQAATEEDAWSEFCRLNLEAAKQSRAKDKNVKAWEQCLRENTYRVTIVEAGSMPR